MSTNRASAPPITNSDAGSRSNKRSRPSELTDLDAKLKNISNHIIQPSPYLLTVPTDYRKGRSQANDWMKNTPFAANEEPVQYVSFLRDWDGGIITPVGGWDNDKGEIMDSAQQRQPARSSTSTPTVNPKKITLSDYKKKAAGQSTSNGASAMNGKHSKEGHTNGATSAPNSVSSASKKPEIVHKRYVDLGRKDKSPKRSHPEDVKPPPSKRPRLSPPISSAPAVQKPQSKAKTKLQLPPLLSPTLPAAIEEALANIPEYSKLSSIGKSKLQTPSNAEKARSVSDSQALNSSSNKSPNKTLNRDRGLSNSSEALKNADSNGASKKPSSDQAHKSKASIGGADQRRLSNAVAPSTTSIKASASSNGETPVNRPSEQRMTLILKLKIPKARRKDLARLLAMKARPSEASKSSKRPEPSPIVKSVERDNKSLKTDRDRPQGREMTKSLSQSSAKSRDKRDREDDLDGSAPPTKRQKHPAALDLNSKPSTPLPPAFKSPVLSHHGSAQKAKIPTPVPDGRSGSNKHDEVRTPQGLGRNGTPVAPNSVERVNREGRSSSNTSSIASSSSKAESLKIERKRLWDHGRSLKRESQKLFQESTDQKSPTKARLAIALGVETLLVFMTAYCIGEELSKARRQHLDTATSWSTISPYLNVVKTMAKDHPSIVGLCTQLEAVCFMSLFNAEGDNATRSSDFAHNAENYSNLMSNLHKAQRLFIEGSSQLPIDDLQRSFPKTWQIKAKAPIAHSSPKILPNNLGGEFYLPLTSITTGLEAARAGRSLLGEWCKNERVDWKPRLTPELFIDTKVDVKLTPQ